MASKPKNDISNLVSPAATDNLLQAHQHEDDHESHDSKGLVSSMKKLGESIQKSVQSVFHTGKHHTDHDETRLSVIDTESAQTMIRGGLDRFYLKYKRIIENARHQMPATELRFQDLVYEADVPVSKFRSDTVGTKFHNIATLGRERTFRKVILNNLNGIIRPGSTTLLIGGPQAGKSSLLKALAGKLKNTSTTTLNGTVYYNGLTSMDLDIRKIVGLIDQTDVHAPTLTVRETIAFADKCLNGLPHMKPEPLQEVAAMRTELLLYLLGLHVCADTVIGNALLRGVSGGERKRVTVGEMLVGGQSVFLCDEISTGLDSAATYDIVKSLGTWAKQLNGTVVVALLQPPAEVVELFDDIIIMNEGHIIYHGALDKVVEYFASIGYDCPERTDLADFLLTVSNKEGKVFRNSKVTKAPENLEEFVDAFYASPQGSATKEELSVGFQVNMDVEKTGNFEKLQNFASFARIKGESKFALPFFLSTWIVLRRQMMLTYRDRPLMFGKLIEALIVGLLVGVLYYQKDSSVYFRMLFFSGAILQRQGWQQIPITMELRNVFYKQRSRNFFRTWSYGLAHAAVWSPVNGVVAGIMGTCIYWLSGLSNDAYAFVVFLITLLAFQHAIGGYFMLLGSSTRTMVQAQAIAAVSVMLFLTFSGNIIYPDLIPNGWKWFYWINPLAWTLRVLLLNEFSSGRYSTLEQVEFYKTYQVYYLKEDCGAGFQQSLKVTAGLDECPANQTPLIWGGIAVLFGYFCLFTSLMTLVLHYVRYDKPLKALITVHESDIDGGNDKQEVEDTRMDIHNNDAIKFVPVTLAFRNLWYSVPDPLKPSQEKVLLKGISGYALPGTMTALMGSTGAGKTTLMDVIAGRKTGGRMEGEILVNGYPKNPNNFSRICGYCEQMDIHSATTTVEEALIFSARLRQPADIPDADKWLFVEEIMRLVELDVIRKKMVGSVSAGGLNYEQRKRLTLGVELVANPSVLFLDEPTSGLDARAALIVIRAVKNIAKSGRTVVCTIHQPSTNIFEFFDQLLLLKMGGYTVFFGPLGENSRDMLAYFGSFPNTRPCPPRYNPATYMLEIIGAGVGRAAADGQFDFVEGYVNSDLRKRNEEVLSQACTPVPGGEPVTFARDIATTFPTQFKLLVRRSMVSYWRTPNYNFVRLLLFPIFGFFFGSVFFNIGKDPSTEAEINSLVALNYMIMDFIGIVNLMTVLEITCAERDVYYRERASNMYFPISYNFSFLFAEMPYLFVVISVFVVIVYFMVGLTATAWQFFMWWFTFLLYTSLCTYIGQWMCALMPNEKVANVAVGAISVIFNVFSGFLLPIIKMASWYKWIIYITPSFHSFNALVTTLLVDSNAALADNPVVFARVQTPQTVSEYIVGRYGLHEEWRGYNLLTLAGEWVTTFLLSLLCLTYIKHIVR